MKTFFKTWIVYALFAFPAFYFVYKHGTPDFGMRDFYDYYKLYNNWDLEHVDAPFNMRLLSSFFVYLFHKAGFHYDTSTAFDKVVGYDRQVFFNAVLFNFLCVVSTCSIIFITAKKYLCENIMAFGAGLVYLLGYGTIFYELMPTTDALSVLLFAVVVHLYISKTHLVIIPLLLLILQREYIFLALGLITVMDLWKYRDKYYLHVLLLCIGCFLIYFILRKTVFYTPKYNFQASPAFFLDSLFHLKFPLAPYIRQTLMTLNIFIIYLIIYAYKKIKHMQTDRFGFWKLILLFIQINIISFAAVFGNNTGRYFYILIPLVIYQLTKESVALLQPKTNS